MSAIRLYVNGAMQSGSSFSLTNAQSVNNGSSTLAYLGTRTNHTYYFNGVIDDVRFYNVVLNSAQVLQLYNEPSFAGSLALAATSYTGCAGSAFTINTTSQSGGTTFWFSQNNLSSPVATGNSFHPPSSATGTAVYHVSQACLQNTVSVSIFPIPVLHCKSDTICSGDTYKFSPSGAVFYTISPGGAVVQPSATTIYTITGAHNNGCVAALNTTLHVDHLQLPSIFITHCVPSGKGISANTTPGMQLTWSSPASNAGSLHSGNFFNPALFMQVNDTTVFEVSGGTCALEFTVAAAPLPQLTCSDATICAGERIMLSPAGSSTYSFSHGQLVKPSVSTIYTISTTNAFGCTAYSYPAISVDACTSITGQQLKGAINIFPNPAAGRICLQGLHERCTFRIFDLNGLELMHGNTDGTIDTGNFSDGFYLLTLCQSRQHTIVKFIIAR